jgi:hypothetical protein
MVGVMATARDWAARIEAWRASGQTSEDFCATRGFSAGILRHWAWKLGKTRRRRGSYGPKMTPVDHVRLLREVRVPSAPSGSASSAMRSPRRRRHLCRWSLVVRGSLFLPGSTGRRCRRSWKFSNAGRPTDRGDDSARRGGVRRIRAHRSEMELRSPRRHRRGAHRPPGALRSALHLLREAPCGPEGVVIRRLGNVPVLQVIGRRSFQAAHAARRSRHQRGHRRARTRGAARWHRHRHDGAEAAAAERPLIF